MKYAFVVGLVFCAVTSACSGPPAPDAEICRDVVRRLCVSPRCDVANTQLKISDDCEPLLLFRSGCDNDDFAFETPSRERFLSCRVPLLRAGAQASTHPSCDDVSEAFDRCPELISFFGAKP